MTPSISRLALVSSVLVYRFALFACQKSDKQAYLDVRKKLADNMLMEDDWAGSATPEYCDAKFGYHS